MFFPAQLDAKITLPRAMSLLVFGLLLLSCAISWPHTMAPWLRLPADRDDFAHGFCIGMALTLDTFALILLLRLSWLRRNR